MSEITSFHMIMHFKDLSGDFRRVGGFNPSQKWFGIDQY